MSLPITTDRLVLRRYTDEDIPELLELVSQPSLEDVVSGRIEATETGVREYIELQNSYRPFEKGKVFELAVERKADGSLLGLVGLIRRDNGEGEMGWALGAEHRGQGYATEAARALMDYAFESLGLDHILADASGDNAPSRRVMERLGMKPDAAPGNSSREDGTGSDKLVYSVRADEWRDGRAAGARG